MSRSARSALLVLLVLILFLPAAWAQTNEQLSFQGRLTDDTGNPVTGSVDLTFRLYDAPTGGTEVWSEAQLAVPVSGGIYSVMLRGADWGSADFTAPYWLSVEVGSDGEMSPRYALAASPYALRAKASDDADTLGGQLPAAFAAAAHGHDHGSLSSLGADHHAQYALLAGRAAGQTLAGGNTTTTTLTLAANTVDAAAATLFLNANGYAGIGTTNPTRILDLWFTTGQGHSGLGLKNVAGAGRHYVIDVADDLGNPGDATGLPPYGFGVVDMTAGQTRLVIDSSGQVGIGVRAPYELLHVRAGAVADVATADDPLVVERNSHAHLNIISATNANGGVLFSDTTRAMGSLYYNHLENKMHFNTNGTGPRMTIDASGNVGIGQTTPTNTLHVNGGVTATSFTGGGAGLTAVNASQLGSQGGSYYLDLANHTGTLPVNKGGTGATSFSAGSVVFSTGSALSQDNANLFWNTTAKRLGIGSSSPPQGKLYATAANGYGLYGHLTGATGVSIAVYGWTQSATGYGVSGYASAGSGTTYGVYGDAASPDGWGVYTPGRLGAGGEVELAGNTILGDDPSDTITLIGGVASSLLPDATNARDVGNTITRWRHGYFAGNVFGTWMGDAIGITKGGTGATSFSAGSMVFSDGSALTQDNANLFWNNTVKRLGIGSSSPPQGKLYATAANGYGLYGHLTGATGVSIAVYGWTQSATGYGVSGYASAGSGTTYGVYGDAASPDGWGVYTPGRLGAGGEVELAGNTILGDDPSDTITLIGRFVNGLVPTTTNAYDLGDSSRRWRHGYFTGNITGTWTGNAIGIANGGTGETSYSAGSVVFSDGSSLTQDNANLFWDNTVKRLGIGTSSPPQGKLYATAANGYGLYGQLTAATGVSIAVYGQTNSATGTGVSGYASAGSGTTYGVYGNAASPDGWGVYTPGRLYAGGEVQLAGDTILGDAAGDDIILTGSVASNILPDASGTRDLGNAVTFWNNAYFSGNVFGTWMGNEVGITKGGTGATSFAAGSMIFSAGTALAEDNSNLFWDDTAKRLGIGTSSPTMGRLQVTAATSVGIYSHVTTTTEASTAVSGRSDSSVGTGVYGYAGASTGTTYGVFGASVSSTGTGVYGSVSNASGENYGVYGTVSSADGYGLYTPDDANILGTLYKGGGAFRIDHPLDPENKYLSHSFVESPDMMNVYNGNVLLDGKGEAVVTMPDWFEALNRDFRYQLTCVGGFAPVYVAGKIAGNRFKIAGGTPGLEVSWQVTGIRKDPFAEQNRILVEEMKTKEERGMYLHPEAYGQPKEAGVAHLHRPQTALK